ncbi:MAG: TldD/PmbA family protein [Bacillota bacterium]
MMEILHCAAASAEQAEVYVTEEERTPISVINGELQQLSTQKRVGIGLRVVKDGRMGKSSSTVPDSGFLVNAALKAAASGNPARYVFPNNPCSEANCFDPGTASVSEETLVVSAMKISDAFKKKGIAHELNAERAIKSVTVENTSGFSATYKKTYFWLTLYTRSTEGFPQMQSFASSGRWFDLEEEHIEQIAAYHFAADNRVRIATGLYPVVFSGQAMWVLLFRLFAGVEGQALARGISPVAHRLGEQIISDKVTVVDDPTISLGTNSVPFDDEGSPCRVNTIYDKGVLSGFLLDLKTASETGRVSTGNGFRRQLFNEGVEVIPSPCYTNFVMIPGKDDMQDVMSQLPRCIYVQQVMGGHTGNIVAGEFSLNLGTAFLVEHGVIRGKIMDAMVAGNVYDVFRKVGAVGGTLSSNRAIFYPFGYAPDVLFEGMSVAGGRG